MLKVKISSIIFDRFSAKALKVAIELDQHQLGCTFLPMGPGVPLHPILDPSVPSSQSSDVYCTDALAL